VPKVSGCGRHFPDCADGHGSQARPEGEGLLPRVQDKADDEVIAESLGQVAQSAEIVPVDRGCCLYLDSYYLALAVLENHVDLYLVPRPVVKELDPGIG
jgi:hypothetical protein